MALDDKTKQDMESGLEHAVRVVQTRFTEFEHKIFMPCLESSRKFSAERPVSATLISIFCLLSFLPVASFIGFTILVTAAFLFVGLGGALIASTILIVAAGSIFAFILGALLLASAFLTSIVVTLFVALRLAQHIHLALASRDGVRQGVKQGFMCWARETRARLEWRVDGASTDKEKEKDWAERIVNNDEHDESMKREASIPSGSEEWQAVNRGKDG